MCEDITLESLAVRLRTLVAEARYLEAESILREYGRHVAQEAARLLSERAAIARLEGRSGCLLEELRRQTLAQQAHAAAKLARIAEPPSPYRQYAPRGRTWQLIG